MKNIVVSTSKAKATEQRALKLIVCACSDNSHQTRDYVTNLLKREYLHPSRGRLPKTQRRTLRARSKRRPTRSGWRARTRICKNSKAAEEPSGTSTACPRRCPCQSQAIIPTMSNFQLRQKNCFLSSSPLLILSFFGWCAWKPGARDSGSPLSLASEA